ncbi:MAG TPA: carbon monoxide dehydrogenase subunit G [Alphaproteobacteria bacterium]|nr:carbon monoxide dehydrogenase subunit G [Alphaproteobacteria bacterium]
MDMTGEYRIEAPRQRVWEALNNPELLKTCIPGCEAIEKTSPTAFTAKVTAKIGPVKATFTGAVTLSDLDPPKGYKISGEGKGGAAGFAKGGAEVSLEEAGAATILRYKASANVGGKLAQIGSRLVDSTAKKLSDEFFGNFANALNAAPAAAPAQAGEEAVTREPPPSEAAAPSAPTVPPVRETAQASSKGLSPLIWVGGVILLIIILLLIFA